MDPKGQASLSWDYDVESGDTREEIPEPLPIPSREVMERRFTFRRTIEEETTKHRKIHDHGGMGDTCRNIALVLYDRERYGASRVTLHRRRQFLSVAPKLTTEAKQANHEDQNEAGRAVAASGLSHQNGRLTNGINGTNNNGTREQQQQQHEQSQSQPQSEPHQHSPAAPVRGVSYPMTVTHEVRTFAEYSGVIKYHSAFFHHLGEDDERGEQGERPPSSKAVSTICIAFSPDSQTMASTHGDHTVKITCCTTGRLLETLEGHPRTPWTVKYHPTDPKILASGCLGHQVRVWDWKEKACIQMIRLEYAIISLSFHPSGNILAIANGTRLHFWGYASNSDRENGGNQGPNYRGRLSEVEQRHMLRCVHFLPSGNAIIVGGMNPTIEEPRRRNRGGVSGGGMSFYLRLWDFDPDAALFGDSTTLGVRRRAISNPRTFVPRVLLYNDGGFDVSPDGKVLCACAEYWLPDGVDNAMELLRHEEQEENSDDDNGADDDGDKTSGMSPARSHVSDTGSHDGTAFSPHPGPHIPDRSNLGHRIPSVGSAHGVPPAPAYETTPRTPPNQSRPRLTLSPPSPPGRRFTGGLIHNHVPGGALQALQNPTNRTGGNSNTPPPPPPPAPPGGSVPPPPPPPPPGMERPHPFSIVSSNTSNYPDIHHQRGRYVPHVVTISLDTTPVTQVEGQLAPGRVKHVSVAKGYRPRLGQLLEACPLDGAKASAVTCVKFSPSTDFCLVGYGIREPVAESGGLYHHVTALYRIKGGMSHVSTMLSGDDDVNIARFHPDSGYGFVYGTKQGRVRVLSTRPWNYYSC